MDPVEVSETASLLMKSGHNDINEALRELIRLQRLAKARVASIKIETPDNSDLDFEIHGYQFVVLRFSRVIDERRAQQVSEQTGLPVIMIHNLEGIEASLATLEPMNKD